MRAGILLLSAILLPSDFAEAGGPLCAKLSQAGLKMSSASAGICAEAREVRARYLAALPQIDGHCARLETEAGTAPSAAEWSENETKLQAMELKKRHLLDRQDTLQKVESLLQTPVDHSGPGQRSASLSEACGDELAPLLTYRQIVYQTLSDLFSKLDSADDALLEQANSKK